MKRGKFIVFEGVSASGKTTQLEKFHKEYPNWIATREPGGTLFGEKIRDAVQGLNGYEVDPLAELFSYSASRSNLVRTLIKPNLEKGMNVICDRYWYSTYAIQGARGISKAVIRMLSKVAIDGVEPDVVLFYDLTPEEAEKRRSGKKDLDRMDLLHLEMHRKIRKNYLHLAKINPLQWYTIDASQSIEEVYRKTLICLKEARII